MKAVLANTGFRVSRPLQGVRVSRRRLWVCAEGSGMPTNSWELQEQVSQTGLPGWPGTHQENDSRVSNIIYCFCQNFLQASTANLQCWKTIHAWAITPH